MKNYLFFLTLNPHGIGLSREMGGKRQSQTLSVWFGALFMGNENQLAIVICLLDRTNNRIRSPSFAGSSQLKECN